MAITEITDQSNPSLCRVCSTEAAGSWHDSGVTLVPSARLTDLTPGGHPTRRVTGATHLGILARSP